MNERPNPTGGLRHVALFVEDLQVSEKFYVDLLGMEVEWRPDEDNVYLCGGCDNLALHSKPKGFQDGGDQRLDHIGFILRTMDDVDDWFVFLKAHDVKMRTEPKTHRDGARSFYCYDPDENVVQMIYHPPISDKCGD